MATVSADGSSRSADNEKLKWSLLVARETVVEQDRVKALNSDRNALEKKAGLSVVFWNGRDLAAQLRKESDRWLIHRAKCLCCDRLKQATCLCQEIVLLLLLTASPTQLPKNHSILQNNVFLWLQQTSCGQWTVKIITQSRCQSYYCSNECSPNFRPTCFCGMMIWQEGTSFVLAMGWFRMQMARTTFKTELQREHS